MDAFKLNQVPVINVDSSKQILSRLFLPGSIIKLSPVNTIDDSHYKLFGNACSQFMLGQFKQALEAFESLVSFPEDTNRTFARVAAWNAAACAIMLGKNTRAIDLLSPMYNSGNLYGIPLWNLAIAYYRQELFESSFKAMNDYVNRDIKGNKLLRAKSELIIACLSVLSKKIDNFTTHILKATEWDVNFVRSQLSFDPKVLSAKTNLSISTAEKKAHKTSPKISPATQKQLLIIAEPKRPERNPALSAFLPNDEIEKYTHSLEILSEGNYEQATIELTQLKNSYPNVTLLSLALAAALLSAEKNDDAYNIFSQLEQSGAQLSGAALWNYACTQVRLGMWDGALKSFLACSETEYRTKPQLWQALKALGSDLTLTTRNSKDTKAGVVISASLTSSFPESVNDCRLEVLRRIFRPKKIPRSTFSELVRLPQKERENVTDLLVAAHKSSPAEAVGILSPLIEQYPSLYTVKAHIAAHLILNSNLGRARSILRQAQKIQHLDVISRYNLMYIYLQDNDFSSITKLLEEATISSLAKEYTFWLALAVARAITGYGKSDEAAARALLLVKGRPTEEIAQRVLSAANIRAASSINTESPSVITARKTIDCLINCDIQGAITLLEEARVNPEQIPEIGSNVLEPQYYSSNMPRRYKIRIIKLFASANRQYKDGQYTKAAASFSSLYQLAIRPSIALNLTAAYLMAEQPKKAVEQARAALRQHDRYTEWSWRLAYNLALSYVELKEVSKAIRIIQKFRDLLLTAPERSSSVRSWRVPITILAGHRRLTALFIKLCSIGDIPEEMRDELASSIEEVWQSVYSPSDDLRIMLAWARLNKTTPDIDGAQAVLFDLSQRRETELLSPTEVRAMRQVREAYEVLTNEGEINKLIDYMNTVIDTNNRERQTTASQGAPTRELENSVGVELTARLCLVRAYHRLNESEQALRELDETDTMLRENSSLVAHGLLVRDWIELTQAADIIGATPAALRYCEQGLKIESEHRWLSQAKDKFIANCSQQLEEQLLDVINEISLNIGKDKNLAALAIEKLKPNSEVLANVFKELLDYLDRNEAVDIEELCDRIGMLARMQLPEKVNLEIDSMLSLIIRTKGPEESQIPVDIDVYGEKIWPKADDERVGSCLLTLVGRRDIDRLIITEAISERRIWEGSVKVGEVHYVRWTVYREDGFTPDTYLDLGLQLQTTVQTSEISIQSFISVLVGSSEPLWPTYPTGALTPDDVPGEELYGRLHLINTITRSLGKKRSQATFFLQAPRQMGKTSLLYFIRRYCPNYILPVYVNLEKEWSKHEPNNLWNYLGKLLIESGSVANTPNLGESLEEADLVKIVSSVCDQLNRDYILLLIDELHCLFEKINDASSILASFRDFLNNRENRIALLLSDRYTRDELEKRCQSEYWAQLSILSIGPLDQSSTKQAIEFPTRGTDVSFLPETIERLYELTGGYPYHVQRIAQYTLDRIYSEPWLVALPSDVDAVVPRILEQNILFQAGLCRPDRIDPDLAEAIAALLEWRDLCDFLPDLLDEISEPKHFSSGWLPQLHTFLAQTQYPDQVISRLKDIGVMREDGESFFSPLLELWLKKMRKEARSLSAENKLGKWPFYSTVDGGVLSARDWQNLDSELVRRAKYRGQPPLKEKSTRADDWETMVREVRNETDFNSFIDSVFRLIIDERDEKDSMLEYPWLFYSYHRTRLIRNYVVHRSKTKTALLAWNAMCMQALGGDRSAYWPTSGEEWRAIQVAILRSLFAGMNNAVEIAGHSIIK